MTKTVYFAGVSCVVESVQPMTQKQIDAALAKINKDSKLRGEVEAYISRKLAKVGLRACNFSIDVSTLDH
jgi:uncharacterized protein YgbK (DUF1537 family)